MFGAFLELNVKVVFNEVWSPKRKSFGAFFVGQEPLQRFLISYHREALRINELREEKSSPHDRETFLFDRIHLLLITVSNLEKSPIDFFVQSFCACSKTVPSW